MKKVLVGLFALDLIVIALARRPAHPPKIRPRGLLDLNTADRNDLLRLPGLSPFLADRIIENRPYRNKIDLLSRRVIPDVAYRRISQQIHTLVDADKSVLTPIAI